MLVGTHAEVLEGLTGVLGTAEDQGVATGRSAESELVEGNGLTTSGDDAGTGGSGEAESSNGNLGEGKETVVVGDGADNNDGALLTLLVDVGDDTRERDGGAVDLGHEEASENNLVEGSVGTA